MTREQFRKLINDKILLLDGATGTNLIKAGMPIGVCPEKWILDNPDKMVELQKSYIEAGSNIIYTPTFSGNRIKLAEYGLENDIEHMNKELVGISKKAIAAAGYRGYAAGNITMTGKQLYPIGDLQFEELVGIYKEQVKYMVEAEVDLFVVETIMSLAEARAAVIAIKEMCDLPIIVSMTYNEDGRTLYGTDPKTAMVVLQSLGVDAVGLNCSTGPEQMIPLIEEMKTYANIPIVAKPNAGLPELVDGETIYPMTPREFADYGRKLVDAGANIIGGCCGTTPKHIEALAQSVKLLDSPEISSKYKRVVSSERKTVDIDINGSFMVVGERINPTGKKKLQEELRAGKLDLVVSMAEEQEKSGAAILDINMGTNGIDEKDMMIKSIYEVSNAVNLPLCIDSSYVDVIEAALRIYPGRALINSISLEEDKIEKLLPIAKKYGAMFILLPLSAEGLPKNKEEKINIINTILDKAIECGFRKEDIIVDGLVATVGANKNAAIEALETIEYCKNELELATICGLSNISFGLPERIFVNTAFLTLAISKGLTMAIANPSQSLLMNGAYAADLLLNKENADITYIENVSAIDTSNSNTVQNRNSDVDIISKVYGDVLKGNKRTVIEDVIARLEEGILPDIIIEEELIPAINKVGVLFDEKKYFLPQLIASAETMEMAISHLEPLLKKKGSDKKLPTIVIATVEGDIHDIGKNLVVLMLKNYGYNVIDMGKDIPAEEIVDKAIEEKAAIIGLSALMTTTMMRMEEVVKIAKNKKCKAKVIIGGAVITESFAKEIGADGYSKDAAEAVQLVKELLGK